MSEQVPATKRRLSPASGNAWRVSWLWLLPLLLLVSCSSKDKAPKSDYAGLRWEQRINKQMKDPYSISSPFQKEVFDAKKSSVKTSEFKTGKFNGRKKFFGSDDKFKSGTFAQSDKASKAAGQTFSGADDQSKMAAGLFKTSQNRFGEMKSPSASKASTMQDDVFDTKSNAAALKKSDVSKRPLIEQAAPYSEDEVKKLLNKG